MKTSLASKNPLRDYRKAVLAVMTKYFAVDAATLRFKTNALRTHRAHGDSPAYVALSCGRACKWPIAPEFQRSSRRR